MLQQKCKLFSEHVADSLRHQDDGSNSANTDAPTDFTCAPTTTEDFLAARVTVPAGDDYIGSDGAFPHRRVFNAYFSSSQLLHMLIVISELSLLSQV